MSALQPVLFLAILAVTFAASFSLSRRYQQRRELAAIQTRLSEGEEARAVPSLVYKLLLPLTALCRPLADRIAWPGYRAHKTEQIGQAGLRGAMTFEDYFGFKCSAAIAVFLAGALLKGSFTGVLPLAAMVVGFFFPDLWLRELVRNRHREITRELPFAVDLLCLSVEAGLDFVRALAKVVERSRPSVLRQELGRLLQDVKLGATRQEALKSLSDRNRVLELTTLCSLLIQSDQLGTSIGTTLRSLSEKMRLERFQRAERLGAEAAQKILIPLVVFIFPAVFVVLIGPVVLKLIYR
jgi:tight adherence protein C